MATYGPNADGIEFTTTQTGTNLAGPVYTVTIVDTTTSTTLNTFTNVPAAQIITGTGSSLTIGSALSLADYFVVPGSSANITFGVSLLSLPTIYVGGAATISSVASLLSGVIFDVYGGTLTASSGLVAGALSGLTINLAYGGEYSNGSGLISLLNGATINFGTNGGIFVANAGGSLLNLSGVTINGFTQGVDKIEFTGLSAPLTSYSVTTSGSNQIINLYASTGTELGTVTVSGTTLATGTFTSGTSGPLSVIDTNIGGSSYDVTLSATSGIVPCFLTGTMIATAAGEKPVECLQVGDLVLTDKGGAMPVRWIGRRKVSPRFADALRVLPVRILAGALGGNLPARDLLISPDHALLIDNTLVNAGALVNGVTILRESMSDNFTYYHVELDTHDLILAEGVSAETFIDHVDRMSFDNWTEHAAIFTEMPEKQEMPYPRAKSARQLPRAIREKLGALVPASPAAA